MGRKKQEKNNKELRVLMPNSLYLELQNKCDGEYRTISDVIRGLVLQYVKQDKKGM